MIPLTDDNSFGLHSDLFSFYKEELAYETANFIHERAKVTEKDAHSVLFELADEVVMLVKKIRGLLIKPEAKDVFERFLLGYTAFHIFTPRYQLEDIFGEEGLSV